jgi:alanine racemase
LDALRHNLQVTKRAAGKSAVWGVLKADAYGHGAPAVARTLERAGIDGFCVALLEEGIELRSAGVMAPILVMGGYYGRAHREVVELGMTPVVYDVEQLDGFAHLVDRGEVRGPVRVHVKVDTGMARLGVRAEGLASFLDALAARRQVQVSGLMTHLACADAESPESMREQVRRFDELTARFESRGFVIPQRHAANSAALLRQEARFDIVRPGLALFGAPPMEGTPFDEGLTPVMRVRSEIVDLRGITKGEPVGYGALFRAERPSRIATVPIGYADGLSRRVSNVGYVLVLGARAPIVGAVSMDMCMIDVTDVPGSAVGDEVVILGPQDGPLGKDHISAAELAEWSGTIAWEVLTNVSRRVPRFYREP